jgi:hypothetical protein
MRVAFVVSFFLAVAVGGQAAKAENEKVECTRAGTATVAFEVAELNSMRPTLLKGSGSGFVFHNFTLNGNGGDFATIGMSVILDENIGQSCVSMNQDYKEDLAQSEICRGELFFLNKKNEVIGTKGSLQVFLDIAAEEGWTCR